MKHRIIRILLLVSVVSIAVIGGAIAIELATIPTTAKVSQTKPVELKPPTPDEILKLVNAERERVGVKPLAVNQNVQKSAQLKAQDMWDRKYFSHNIPGTDNPYTTEMGKLILASCSQVGENIADNSNRPTITSQEAFTAWKNSPAHYKAMIDPSYTATGIGVAGDKVVQHFCIAK